MMMVIHFIDCAIQVEVEEATPRPETESLYDLPSNVLPRDHHHQSRDLSPFVRGADAEDHLSSSNVELWDPDLVDKTLSPEDATKSGKLLTFSRGSPAPICTSSSSCEMDGEPPSLPPRTPPVKTPRDHSGPPPVPARDSATLPRPAPSAKKPTPDATSAPSRPPPSRPVPVPEHLVDLRPDTTTMPAGVGTTKTLTHSKRMEHQQQRASSRHPAGHTMTLDRRIVPGDNKYVMVKGSGTTAAAPPIPERREGTPPKVPSRDGVSNTNPFLTGYNTQPGTATPPPTAAQKTFSYAGRASTGTPPKLQMTLSKQAQELFDSIPDSPSPTEPQPPPSRAPLPAPTTNTPPPRTNLTTITPSALNSKYPTIKNSHQGMVQVKQGYMNVGEVKGALSSIGQKGVNHKKLSRRSVPNPPNVADIGYTPMKTMEQRLKMSIEPECKSIGLTHSRFSHRARENCGHWPDRLPIVGYEPMKSHSERLQCSTLPPQRSNVAPSRSVPTRPAPTTTDISSQPEFQRLEQLDKSLTGIFPSAKFIPYSSQEDRSCPENNGEYLPMCPATDDDQYLDMSSVTLPDPDDGYLDMGPGEGYLAMGGQSCPVQDPSDGYLAMGPGGVGDPYSGLNMTSIEDNTGYLAMNPGDGYQDLIAMATTPPTTEYEVEYVSMDSG
eukprot:sb/3462783/